MLTGRHGLRRVAIGVAHVAAPARSVVLEVRAADIARGRPERKQKDTNRLGTLGQAEFRPLSLLP